MRRFSVLTTIALLLAGMGMQGRAQTTSCTGLCLQQTMCTGNATTSISGKVFAPNGTDPLPNVTVYIPNDTVQPFTPGVSCPTVGAPPSGSPLVGAITAVDGSFTLNNAPVGTNIPIVAVSGRWRVQSTVNTTACANTVANLSMPQNQSQGDIPKIAIASGDVDQVECILRRVGISDSEFTDPTGSGRINIYKGTTNSGAVIDAATPTQASLMENSSTLNQYDVLMLPCQGSSVGGVESGTPGATELANFIAFANAGGRIYSSHFSYAWMYKNPPFNSVVNWDVGQGDPADGTATVNTSFSAGQTLSQWLQLPVIDASTTAGQMSLDTLRVDTNGVVAPTQSWLTLNNSSYGNPVMQFVFNTPLATTANPTPNQCGRVLFNEYHVENGSSSPLNYFPSECSSSGAMTPQEKLLEYMLFELTSDGGQPTLTPATQDFGSEAVNYPTAAQTFTWTNNSSFPLTVGSATITAGGPQFSIATDGCTNVTVAGAASCTVTVILTPSALGAASGTLTLVSGGLSQSASLTGTGVPGYSLASGSSLNFGNVEVGDCSSQTLTLTSNASGPQTVPSSTITANYTISTAACGATVAAGGSCVATVTFKPTALGVQTGTLVVNSSGSPLTVSLTGNGIPGFILSPATLSFGNVDVGATAPLTLTLTSVAQRSLATPVFATTGYLFVQHGRLRSNCRRATELSSDGELYAADDWAADGHAGRQLDRPGIQRVERNHERQWSRLHAVANSQLGHGDCWRWNIDDRDADTDCRLQRTGDGELYGRVGRNGCGLLAESDDADAERSDDGDGQFLDHIAVHGDRIQRTGRTRLDVAGGGDQRRSAVAETAWGVARWVAGSAAGRDRVVAEWVHRQTAGSESDVDRGRELLGDRVGNRRVSGSLGDVQPDGDGEVAREG